LKYPCLTFSQRPEAGSPKFCIFYAPVGEVISWSVIPRLTPGNSDGIQRAKNDYKVRGIRSFLAADVRNTIPTAVVITLGLNAYAIGPSEAGGEMLEIIPEKKESIFVVDGQHRLYGLFEFNGATKVPVVAILEASADERAFQFVVINNKVSKVSPDHIRALALKYSGDSSSPDLDVRLRTARLSLSKNLGYVGLANDVEDSPFKGLLSLPDTPPENKWITPAAVETALSYIQSKSLQQLDDDDSHFEFFLAIWSTIKSTWSTAFAKDSKLLSKVGIQCMTRYATDAIDYMVGFSDEEFDFGNREDVTKAVLRVLKFQEEDFWTSEWSISIADTKSVRDEIEEALRIIQQNIRHKQPWRNGVTLVKADFAG
jgi:DGQHR domain-containing protein